MKKQGIFLLIAIGAFEYVASQGNSMKIADSFFFAGNWKAAVKSYEEILKKDTTNSIAIGRLGFSYHNLGEHTRALENYLIALQKNNNTPFQQVYYARLARIYALQNKNEEALKSLETALVKGYANIQELDTASDFNLLRKENGFKQLRDKANANAFPCSTNPKHREFDFWVGEWDVYATGTNALVGHSLIQIASGGCMILENWTALAGPPNNGKSMNFVDPKTNKWEQVWAGSGGGPNYVGRFYNGEYEDGAMRFDFEQTSANGNKQIGRFIFYNKGPNQVRQYNEVSADGGKTWSVVYDFTYKRKEKK